MQGLNSSSKDTIEPASRRLSYLFLAGILFFKEQKKGFGAPLLILTDSYSFSAPSHQENLESSSSARGKHSPTLPFRKALKSRFLLADHRGTLEGALEYSVLDKSNRSAIQALFTA